MERVLHQHQGCQDGPVNRPTGRVQQARRTETREHSYAVRRDDQRGRYDSHFCPLISLFSPSIERPLKREARNPGDFR